MTYERIREIRKEIKTNRPLIHCITNPISINACANAVLAVGARPVMAEHPEEVSAITETAAALMINLGNITDARMGSMAISARVASKKHIPAVLDLVGIACSRFRRDFAKKLIKENTPNILKGNYSEILALYDENYESSGVDAEASLDNENILKAAVLLAKKNGSTILASGKTDIITDGSKAVFVNNGTVQMARITGTGCMLGAIAASFASVSDSFEAAVSAAVFFGICGENSAADGTGTFMIRLYDSISLISDTDIQNQMKAEEIKIEKL